MSSSIQAVFFDVGATLLTPSVSEGATFSHIAKQLGLSIDPLEVDKSLGQMYSLYEQLYEQDDSFWSDDVRAQAIWIEMYEYLASLINVPHDMRRELAVEVYRFYFSPSAWQLYDDVIVTLDTLKDKGIRMGLISNWDSTLAPIIEGLNLSKYFETILSSAVVRLHKPMPEIFHLALDNLGVQAEHAVHVGDHVYADAHGAREVGITPVLLDRNNRYPDYEYLRVASLAQICSMV